MTSPYAQSGFRLRFDWGPAGAAEVGAGLVAVVDVLSFTTAVTVAVDQGIDVLPYRWRDESAVTYAEEHGAVLAVGRSQAGETGAPVGSWLHWLTRVSVSSPRKPEPPSRRTGRSRTTCQGSCMSVREAGN